jgi:hypothetical protein
MGSHGATRRESRQPVAPDATGGVAPDATRPVSEPLRTITHAGAKTLAVGEHGEVVEILELPDGRTFAIPPQPDPDASKLTPVEQRCALDNIRRLKAQLAASGSGSERSEVPA